MTGESGTGPRRIGAYRVERLLGAGSFATVWLGRDPALDARVAIKVLADNWSHDLRVRERFQQEARLLWRLADDRGGAGARGGRVTGRTPVLGHGFRRRRQPARPARPR